ncbi:hypothetical protein ACO0QE_003529 [Hanseniaspora vineae]
MQLEKKYHTGPSYAVKFYAPLKHIWTAEGPFLKIYDQVTGDLVNSCRIFNRNKIHGISLNGNSNVLLFGGTNYVFTSADKLYNSTDVTEGEKRNCEWITSGALSEDDKAYLLTCYNKVLIFDFEQQKHVETKALAGERSILYSGSIKLGRGSSGPIICAGTVMGGVLVWDCNEEQLLHNLKGHEGSIFDAVCSDKFDKVASCSDDRTIRVWDIQSGSEMCFAFGHTARIWSLKFINDDTQIVSTSEDCTMRVWDIKNSSENAYTLEQSSVHETNQIKNVWGCDVSGSRIVTTGNDGRIKITDLSNIGDENRNLSLFSLETITFQSGKPFVAKEMFKSFQWFNFGLVVITSKGRCFQYDKTLKTWSFLFESEKFANYNFLQGFENVCIITNSFGDIKVFHFDKEGAVLKELDLSVKDKLTKTLNTLCVAQKSFIYLLLESPNPNDPLLLMKIDKNDSNSVSFVSFKKPKNFSSSCFEIYENVLLIGSRMSTLGIFDISDSESESKIIKQLSAGDNTTSITFSGKYYLGNPIFSITNRDGFYNFISVNTQTLEHIVIHSNKIAKGFLQHGNFNSKGEYIIDGFKSNIFHISNETQNYEIVSESCGGAHRQWGLFDKNDNSDGKMFVYARGPLHVRDISDFTNAVQTLNNGIHGREIRDITIQPGQSGSNEILFVTASEDTTLKLCSFNTDSGKITQYWTQRKHVSGLQRAKFISSSLLISCSGREELFLWELHKSDDDYPFLNLRESLPSASDNPDLRIMDFDFVFHKDREDEFLLTTVYSDSSIKIWYYTKNGKFQLVLDGKYETCCLFNTAFMTIEDRLVLIVTPTDGHVAYWDITEYVPFQTQDNQLVDIDANTLSNTFKTEALPSYLARFPVHQSGTKTLDIFKNTGTSSLTLLTGGDDNALGISVFSLKDDGSVHGEQSQLIEKAAASTITSVSHFTKDNENFCMVTSVDQTLRVWKIAPNNTASLITKQYTTIADTNSLDIYDNKYAIVGGVGCSVWAL